MSQPHAQSADARAASPRPPRPIELHQPFVHDLVAVLGAPFQAWSRRDGMMDGSGAQGIYLGDTRIVDSLRVEVADGSAQLTPLPAQVSSARTATFTDVVSQTDDVVDPLVDLERTRTVQAGEVRETIRFASADDRPRSVRIRVLLGTDATSMSAIKDPRVGARGQAAAPAVELAAEAAEGCDPASVARWEFGANGRALVRASGAVANEGALAADESVMVDGTIGQGSYDGEIAIAFELALEGPGEVSAMWRLEASDPTVPFTAPEEPFALSSPSAADAAPPSPASSPSDAEARLADQLLTRSLSDLDALRMQVPEHPEQQFYAAGAPWYFTLFGRDSLITASLALPVDRATALSTLRTLAARQGTKKAVTTAEAPGKILHEVRAQGMDMRDSHLPPVYYGTIDATPLWIELLHELVASGTSASEVADLHPALEAAALWLLEHADADDDGFLEYIDESGHGLANQGWKDSGDSVRFADGRIAEGTIALAEVQGYAYAAALHAADLLEELPADGADDQKTSSPGSPAADGAAGPAASDLPARLRGWAADLRGRFRVSFWCEDGLGPYVALALDGAKEKVDGVASNMGHLLGTGILNADEEAIIVRRLMDPTMFSGYGIRTLSTTNGAYWPMRYHGGSVWTHDTGYILRGMMRAGFDAEARELALAVLAAAERFDLRMPELFSGLGADEVDPPMPYPASCRPQAWAAATAVPVAQALGRL